MRLSRRPSVLPGFGLALGTTLAWLGIIVLFPLAALLLQASKMTFEEFASAISSPRAFAAYRLTFGASLAAAAANALLGFGVAWVLVRYRFPGRRIVDALVDLPFALPTAASGIAFATIYSRDGWLGGVLERLGVRAAFTPLGVVLCLVFVGLPFVIRTLQPALEEIEPEVEQAASSLGATPWQTFVRVIAPAVRPALSTGFALAFARALGEYGSVIFISGNLPYRTEIVPLLIVIRLEGYDYAGATALAVVMLASSFLILLGLNCLRGGAGRVGRHVGGGL